MGCAGRAGARPVVRSQRMKGVQPHRLTPIEHAAMAYAVATSKEELGDKGWPEGIHRRVIARLMNEGLLKREQRMVDPSTHPRGALWQWTTTVTEKGRQALEWATLDLPYTQLLGLRMVPFGKPSTRIAKQLEARGMIERSHDGAWKLTAKGQAALDRWKDTPTRY